LSKVTKYTVKYYNFGKECSMKKLLLITSCLFTFPHMSYAMGPESSAAQEEQYNGRLTVKKTLEIPYKRIITLFESAETTLFPTKSFEPLQKNVDVEFSFDENGIPKGSLLFPANFPSDLQSRISTAFNGEISSEERNPNGFGCLRGSVMDDDKLIGSYTEKLLLPWGQIERMLMALKTQTYNDLLNVRDGVPVIMSPRYEITAQSLSVIPEEAYHPLEVLEKVTQTRCPSLSTLRSWFKRMDATVTTEKKKRKIKQLTVTVGDHSVRFSSRTDKRTLRGQALSFVKQIAEDGE
jgi:hypothetical protein